MSEHSTANIQWRFLAFGALSLHELYELLRLRSEVFVVEQACAFSDMDGADATAMHLLGTREGQLVAYARCFEAGVKFPEASIGRVATHASARGKGIGHMLIAQAIMRVEEHWGAQAIRIGAQSQLEHFYRQHGFVPDGGAYFEDGILHLQMLWLA